MPRYKQIWDVSVVLQYLKTLHPLSSLTLKDLTHKLVMLISITTAQRLQTLHMLNIGLMEIQNSAVVFSFDKPMKQSNPRNAIRPLILEAYLPDKALCVYNVLLEYISRTESIRGVEQQLLVSYQKPYKKVSRDTISRWIRTVMQLSGLDLTVFKAHSTRAASTSAAKRAQVPIQDIIDRAGWSSAQTFATFYKREIVSPNANSFARAVLQQ